MAARVSTMNIITFIITHMVAPNIFPMTMLIDPNIHMAKPNMDIMPDKGTMNIFASTEITDIWWNVTAMTGVKNNCAAIVEARVPDSHLGMFLNITPTQSMKYMMPNVARKESWNPTS